jgi:hypothetical protein
MSSNGTTWVRAAGNAGKSFLTNFNNTSVLQTGLAVSSGDTNSTLTVTFDNVSIVRPY